MIQKIRLYHGSNQNFDVVDLSKSRDKRDFGKGFYLTTLKSQAEDWANTISQRYGGPKYLYVFDLTIDATMKVKEFEDLTLDWLEMIKKNRMAGGVQHEYDIIMGPVANDKTMRTVALYVEGLLDEESTIKQLRYFEANNQVSLHSQKAVDGLRLIERVELD